MTKKQSLSIVEIARLAGVGKSTVARAINEPEKVAKPTLDRINAFINKENYIPNKAAGSLVTGRSKGIAVIVPTLRNAVFGDLFEGMSSVLVERKYQLYLNYSRYDVRREEDFVRESLGWRPTGFVVTGLTHSDETVRMMTHSNTPFVEVMELNSDPIDMSVGYSNRDAARSAAVHLIKTGRRRIAFGYPMDESNERASRRYQGYADAIADGGLQSGPVRLEISELSYAAGFHAMMSLLDGDSGIDAVFFGSDVLAVGALQACARRGVKVPDDVAIVGFNDLEIASACFPSLSTVRVDTHRIGRLASELLLQRAHGTTPKQKSVDVGFKFIRRESS